MQEEVTDSKPEVSEIRLDFKGKTILVAEDDDSSYSLLKILLEKTGFTVLRAKDGNETVTLCENNFSIDLVLMDIHMPHINGYDATRQIKKVRPDLPIIAQTAYATHGDREKSLNEGCNDYISKPIKKMELFQLIAKYLN